MRENDRDGAPSPNRCPLDQLLKLLNGKWTPHILFMLGEVGSMRFGEIRRTLSDDVSAKILSETLQRLCDRGLVARSDGSAESLKVTYTLTDMGRATHTALRSLDEVARALAAAEGGEGAQTD